MKDQTCVKEAPIAKWPLEYLEKKNNSSSILLRESQYIPIRHPVQLYIDPTSLSSSLLLLLLSSIAFEDNELI